MARYMTMGSGFGASSLASARPSARAAGRSPLPSEHAQSAVILVVDDDPDILDALCDILEVEGFTLRRARNGKEALAGLEPLPDIILLDLMMPVMDGPAFVRHLKENLPRALHVPIIVLSADRHVSARSRELGAVGFLSKPFELTALLSMVEGALATALDA